MSRPLCTLVLAVVLLTACGPSDIAGATGTAEAMISTASSFVSVVEQSESSVDALSNSLVAAQSATASATSTTAITSATSSPQLATTVANTAGNGTGSCNNKYMPVKANAQWVYNETGPQGKAMPQSTETILTVQPSSFTLEEKDANGAAVTGTWQCTQDGLSSAFLDNAPMLGPSSGNQPVLAVKADNVSGVWLPKDTDWAVGKTWTVSYSINISGTLTAKGTVSTVFTIASQEQVTVPAGTFTAYKVTEVSTQNMTVNMFGTLLPTNQVVNSAAWYVANVGRVKYDKSIGSLTEINTELVSYTI